MTLIHAIDDQIVTYPDSMDALRKAHPNVSFPVQPTDDDLAIFNRYRVTSTPKPLHDARTERVDAATPALTADGWQQAWTVRPATEQEIIDYDLAHAPEPDWMGFGIELITHDVLGAWYNTLPMGIASGLSIGLKDASQGDPRLFVGIWQKLTVSADVTAALAELMVAHHLPSEFVSALTPPAVEP